MRYNGIIEGTTGSYETEIKKLNRQQVMILVENACKNILAIL